MTPACEHGRVARFVDRFSITPAPTETAPAHEVVSPPWYGPPEHELGIVVPQSLVAARSMRGAIALRFVVAFSTGLLLDLVATARGLRESRIQATFHQQLLGDPDEDLPDAFLRVGVEYPDGRQASNLANRSGTWVGPNEPAGPVLVYAAGGGGSGGTGRLRLNPGYWLWPLPSSGSLGLFVEWPEVEIELSFVEIPCAPLLEAAARSEPLWPDPL
jgi:hypothetical protein